MKSEKLYEAIGYVDEKWIALMEESEKSPAKGRERRHFLAYELKKLLGLRYLWVFLAVFLAVNSVTAWISAGKSSANMEPSAMIGQFFRMYEEDPVPLDAYYEKMTLFNEEQRKLSYEAMRRGEEYVPEVLPNVYSTEESFPDRLLFQLLYTAIQSAEGYPETIDMVISRAVANLDEFAAMGLSPDSYSWKYQEKVIGLYEIARDVVELEPVYTRGWNEYFAYDTENVFLFLMLVMLGTVIFTGERQSGFLPILRTARFGRMRTAAAKGMTALILSSVMVLLFTASTFAVFGLRLGFSDAGNAIQSLNEFTLSPYLLTIGEYFLITLGLRLLATGVFTLAVVAISVLVGNQSLVYLGGLGLFGLNFLLYLLPLRDHALALKHLNLLALADGDPLFVRYRAVNLFGNVAGYVPFAVPLFLTLTAVFFALACFCYTYRGSGSFHILWLENAVVRGMTGFAKFRTGAAHIWEKLADGKTIAHRRRSYSLSLFRAECFKTLISSRFIFALVVLLVIKVGYSAEIYKPAQSYFDRIYREYMTELAGEVTEEKLSFLAEERASIDEIISRQYQMQKAFAEGEITYEEYREYMNAYQDAFSRTDPLEAVQQRADYLRGTADSAHPGWFVYDTGWEKLFSADADLFLYAAILLLLTGTFASEYGAKSSSGAFAQLLRSTKHGREKTFYAKLASAETIAFVLALTMGSIDVVSVFTAYAVPNADAPLLSLPLFAGVESGLTLGGYVALFLVMRLIGALLLSLLVCALSELLCKYLPVLGSTVALTMVPALCAAFGVAAAEKVNFLNLLAGTPLFLQSMRSELFGGWAMLALWLGVWTVVIGAILAPAKRMFVK